MKTKSKKFSTAILLIAALLLGMPVFSSPFAVSAAAPDSIYVGGVELTSGEYLATGSDTPSEEAPSGGYAYFDAAGLVLKDYEYKGWGYEESQNNFYLVYAEGDLNIILLGESSFKASASVNADFTGIYVNNGSLNINGPGKLTVDASESIRVNAGDLSIEGGRLNLTHRGNNYGIYALGSVSISGGIHSVTGFYGAVYTRDGISISGGSLTATGDNYAIDGNFSMTSGSLLAIASGDGASAFNSSKSVDFSALTDASVFGYDNAEGNSAQIYDDADKVSYKRVLVKPTVHNVWIGGTQLSDTNMPTGVFFEPISRTLTLTDFTCENTSGYAFSGALKALVYSEDDLNIILSGENTLEAMSGEYGIKLANNRLLTIDTKEGETGALTVSGAYGIDAVSEIKGGSITVAGTEAAMNTVPGMSAAPDLRSYYETACIKVSENADGTALTQDYDAAEIAEYKYIRLAEGARIEYYLNGDLKSSEIREIGEEYQLPTYEYELPFAYEFDGWALGSVDGTTVYDEGDTVTVTENMAFHAVLKQKTATVRVYYPKAGAHAAVEYMLPYGTHTLDFIDAVVTPPEGLELKGFSEWYMGEPVTEIEVDLYGASLYAIWGASDGVEFYDLYVGGIPVTAQNKGDILGDGTAVYNSDTKTLTLTNMSLTAEEALFADGDYSLGSIIALGELNILLVGESSIVAEYGDGIYVEELTLSAADENGKLDIDACGYAICGNEITVNGGSYDLVGSSGLDGYSVTVNGGNFDIEAADDESGAGIYAYRAVINGGVINILFDRSIYVSEGGLEINGGEITVTDVGTAIEAGGDVMIKGGKLTLHGLNAMSYGIFASDADVIISGDGTVVEIDGFGIGIYLETNESRFGMDGGSLKISAEDFGIFVREQSPYNEPYIKSGTLEISAGEAGGTFAYLHSGTPRPVPYNYIIRGKSDATASTNADGSAAVVYNEDDLRTYKYVRMTVTESYGIIIADGEDNGVMITKNNYADVLGDGTVSYDPKTNTLTLKGYKYEGEGFIYDGWSYGILALPNYMDTLTLLLEGENEITLTETEDVEAICVDGADVVIKGDGSLEVNSLEGGIYVMGDINVQGANITVNAFSAVSAYDFKMTGGSVNLNATYVIYTSSFAIAGGALTVTAVGDGAYGVYVEDYFVMNGGNVKITTVDKGIYTGTSVARLEVLGGTLEISTKTAGYAFARYDSGDHLPILPDAFGEGVVTASVNEDGSDSVTFRNADFDTYKYVKATVKLRFGIVIADGEDNGVMIDEDNYTDPLGDGTVSYDPKTNTLTLKGYKYEGEGFEDGGWFYGIFVVPDFMDTLTLLLEGENEITLTATEYAEAICVDGADVVIKGDGSLEVNSPEGGICLYYASLEIQGGNTVINASCPIMTDDFTMNGGALTVTARGANVCGMMVYGFTMNGGSLRIGTDYVGIAVWLDGALTVCGGTLEISTKTAGYAFSRYDAYEDEYLPALPTLAGAHIMLASLNEDGSGAVALKEAALESYKYVSIHVHTYGTDWRTDGAEHWNECACGDKANKEAHSGGTATCQAKAKCEVCNAEYGEFAPCSGGVATHTSKAICATCGNEYGDFLQDECSGVLENGQGATCTVDGWKDYYRCECGKYYEDANCQTPINDLEAWKVGDGKITAAHTGTPEWTKTSATHEKKYTCCGEAVVEEEAHEWNNGTCSECEYVCLHTGVAVTKKDGQDETCTVDGWNDYYQCACGKYFADEACTMPVSDLEAWKVNDGKIAAEHKYGNLVSEDPVVHTPTQLEAGMRAHYKCSVCQEYFDENKNPTTEGALIIPAPEHSYGDWIKDNEKHWKVCSCGLKADEHAHNYTDNADMTCNDCGFDRTVLHTCGSATKQDGQGATCTVNGWIDYYKCSCGKLYTEAACTNEIASLEEWKNGAGKIVASHSYGDLVAKEDATCSQTGMQAHFECSVCHTLFDADKAVKTENELTIAIDANAHTYGAWASNGDGTHTRVCSLNAEHKENGNCAGGTATCTEKAVCATCNTAYGNTTDEHSYGAWTSNGDGTHTRVCSLNSEHKENGNCAGGTATCTEKAVCATCNTAYGNTAAHTDSDSNGKCDACEYQMSTTPNNPNNTPDNPNNTPDDPSEDKDGLGAGAIVGIVIGSVAVAGTGGFALFWFVIKKKSFGDLAELLKKLGKKTAKKAAKKAAQNKSESSDEGSEDQA